MGNPYHGVLPEERRVYELSYCGGTHNAKFEGIIIIALSESGYRQEVILDYLKN